MSYHKILLIFSSMSSFSCRFRNYPFAFSTKFNIYWIRIGSQTTLSLLSEVGRWGVHSVALLQFMVWFLCLHSFTWWISCQMYFVIYCFVMNTITFSTFLRSTDRLLLYWFLVGWKFATEKHVLCLFISLFRWLATNVMFYYVHCINIIANLLMTVT